MARPDRETAIDIAAAKLRRIVFAADEGALIGSEDALIAQLGFSRSTVRQVARLLEREGLLRVRRGIRGGYFGARPDADTIEETVSTYLESIAIDASEATVLASALWVNAMRKACNADPVERLDMVARMRRGVAALSDEASFGDVLELERAFQEAVFALAASAYIKLIFDINVAFFRRRFVFPQEVQGHEHRLFVGRWRAAKLLEASAIELADPELGAIAARYSRQIWHERVARRLADAADENFSKIS